jgi:hypothetical protein
MRFARPSEDSAAAARRPSRPWAEAEADACVIAGGLGGIFFRRTGNCADILIAIRGVGRPNRETAFFKRLSKDSEPIAMPTAKAGASASAAR